MKLIRLTKLHANYPDWPFTRSSMYTLYHTGKLPGLIVKIGGSLCVDVDRLADFAVVRDIPLRKEKTDEA